MTSARYIARRLVFSFVVLFAVSILTFLIFIKLPSADPARLLTRAPQTAEQYQRARANLGLDEPLHVQYLNFASGMVPLPGLFLNEDVYYSYRSNIPVSEELARRAPYTVVLGIGTLLLTLVVAVPLGVLGGVKPGSWVDRLGTGFVLLGISVPTFWLGIVALFVFWFRLGIAPPSGIPYDQSAFDAIWSGRYVLPWIVGAIGLGAIYVRLLRGELQETMESDFIRTAIAKGATPRRVILHHGFRATLGSIVTVFAFDLANIVLGSVVIETVFNIPGIGKYAVESLNNGDLPAIMGITVVFAMAIVLFNLIADIAYTFLDPRIHLGARSVA